MNEFKYKVNERFLWGLFEDIILTGDFFYDTGMELNQSYSSKNVFITKSGGLYLRKGFRWNGGDGPTLDTKACRLPTALHDALYRVVPALYKKEADRVLKTSMDNKVRGTYWYYSLILFGSGISETGERLYTDLEEWRNAI